MRTSSWWWQRAFVYVGRMSAYKGVPQIVEAWTSLAEAEECPPLWLIGGAPEEIAAMREHLHAANLIKLEASGRLVWWGYLDSSGISAVLTRALALVTHSRYEPGGRVILEAMAEGVPVIATPHGFALDLVRDWDSGFLIPFDDVARLRRCMAHFVNQPLLRSVLGERARSRAIKALDEWNFTRTHFAIYDAVVAGERSTAPSTLRAHAKPRSKLRRRLPCHYPFLEREPSTDCVRTFFQETIDTQPTKCLQLSDLADSSVIWHLESSVGQWIVKWPASRLESRPLWNPSRSQPLIRSGADRFRSELLASKLPSFAPIRATDKTHRLLLQPWVSVRNEIVNEEMVYTAGSLYRQLYSHRPNAPWLESVERDWGDVSQEELDKVRSRAQREAQEPWDTTRHFSLRMARRRLEILLCASDRPPLEDPLLSEARDGVRALAQVAEVERSLPVVVCHGSAGWRHIGQSPSGRPVLLDGEHIHPGWPGEDYAALLLDGIPAGTSPDRITERLESHLHMLVPDSTQRIATGAWLAVLTLEDLVRVSVMDLVDDLSEYLRQWQGVRTLVSQLTQ